MSNLHPNNRPERVEKFRKFGICLSYYLDRDLISLNSCFADDRELRVFTDETAHFSNYNASWRVVTNLLTIFIVLFSNLKKQKILLLIGATYNVWERIYQALLTKNLREITTCPCNTLLKIFLGNFPKKIFGNFQQKPFFSQISRMKIKNLGFSTHNQFDLSIFRINLRIRLSVRSNACLTCCMSNILRTVKLFAL